MGGSRAQEDVEIMPSVKASQSSGSTESRPTRSVSFLQTAQHFLYVSHV